MQYKLKLTLISSLSTVAVTSALALSGCGDKTKTQPHVDETGTVTPASDQPSIPVAEGEGEGEGGGEGEGASGPALASDNVAFLTQLSLMRGHLYAFYSLHKAGAYENAATHAKHPESELYGGIVPALEARDIDGFAASLTTLADAAASDGDIDAAYIATRAEIERVEIAIGASHKEKLLAIAAIIRVAGDEYKIGVADDGTIVNLHEYQDALGFVYVAGENLDAIVPEDDATQRAIDIIREQLIGLEGLFVGLTPSQAPGKASTLYGAAARIEIAALGV